VDYILTDHARKVLAERDIAIEWLESTLEFPTLREPDTSDPTLERRYRAIPEREGRVLRVVVDANVVPLRVVSVFFDRDKRGQL
jgi:hypothetical protein